MFRTFFRNIPLRSFSSYVKNKYSENIIKDYPNVINDEVLSALENISKMRVSPFQSEAPYGDKELLKQFPNRISKKQMDEFLTKSETIRKYSSVY